MKTASKKPKQGPRVTPEEYRRVWGAIKGRIGGKSRSEKKLRAVRLNGLKGGRPRKAQLELPIG